ncbi:MAG: hypothetical protein AAF236_00720 [Verrucomicrobiota bacterium]
MPGERKNPRRGRVEGKPDAPAEFKAGDAKGPEFDAAEIAEELGLYWVDGSGDKLLVKNADVYATWNERKVIKLMRAMPGRMIAVRPREGECVSETDQVMLHVMQKRSVELALPALAGHRAGVYEMSGGKVVVKTSPRVVEPVEGSWETVRELIEGRLGDQSRYFHSWMQVAYESLHSGDAGNYRPGHALIFAGRAGSAKSRLQHQVVTGMLGCRSADPGAYMFGRADFNSEMVSAEHLLMEDPVSSTLTKDRVFFGEMVKGIVANDTHRLHKKKEDAITGSPFWRLTISVNDDPDKMRVLPLLTPDTRDKLMIFRVKSAPLPLPTDTLTERAAFREAIASELPAYAWHLLNEFEIPEDIRSTRFGVDAWQEPSLVGALFEDTPSAELLALIDAAVFESPTMVALKLWELPEEMSMPGSVKGKIWKGTAINFEKLLLGEFGEVTCSVSREAKKLFAHNKCDRLLGRLAEDAVDRVGKHRTKRGRGWMIARPPAGE